MSERGHDVKPTTKLARASNRRGWAVALCVAWGVMLLASSASAVKLRIRGSALLEGRVLPADRGVEFQARVSDDTNRPIGKASVRVRLQPTPTRLPRAEACGNTQSLHSSLSEYIVVTAPDGSLCLRIPDFAPATGVQLVFDGDDNYDPLSRVLQLDRSRSAVTLLFQPPPATLALEREQHSIWVATKGEGDLGLQPQSLSVELYLKELSGQETKLASSLVTLGQRAQFVVPSAKLGPPGAAQLGARFRGSNSLIPAETLVPVLRTTEVQLALEEPPGTDSGSGTPLELSVNSSAGPVPSGSVEALLGGRSLLTSPVRDGRSSLRLVFDADASGAAKVTLRYLPSSPAWVPTRSLEVEVPVPPPSPWGRIALVGSALLIAAWLIRAWYRPGREEQAATDERKSIPSGKPAVELLEPAQAGAGWRGRVVDAHDGTPIANARVTLLIPAFSTDGVARAASADAQGSFELPHVDFADAEGARFRVEAPWHSTLEKPVPRPGSIAISMVSRRRSVLERLVSFSQRLGRPWATDAGATPGHIAGVAQVRARADIERWARDVEQAAYGATPPDAEAERLISEQQPVAGPPA